MDSREQSASLSVLLNDLTFNTHLPFTSNIQATLKQTLLQTHNTNPQISTLIVYEHVMWRGELCGFG